MRAFLWFLALAIPLGIVAAAIAWPLPCEITANRMQAPVSDSIVVGPVNEATAKNNRLYVEEKSGALSFPTGPILFDRGAAFRSNSVWVGVGSTLKQEFTGGNFPWNCTMATAGAGMGHVDFFTHSGRATITVSAPTAERCPVGTLLFLWVSTNSTPSVVKDRRTVIARNGNVLTLDGAVDARCNVLKWFSAAVPISPVVEGSTSVVVSRNPAWFAINDWVLVTSGPSIANEANGEMRKVIGRSFNTIFIDRPLRRNYKESALAKIVPVENVTVRDCVIDLPINTAAESLYISLCRGWRFERCTIRKTALGNCADMSFVDCTLGSVQVAASSHDIRFVNCRIDSIAFEEGCHDNLIDNSRLGPVQANMNVVSMRAQSERLTIRNSHLFGGAWPSSQILFDGPSRDCVFENVTMTGRVPCWLKGGFRLVNVYSDGDIWSQ